MDTPNHVNQHIRTATSFLQKPATFALLGIALAIVLRLLPGRPAAGLLAPWLVVWGIGAACVQPGERLWLTAIVTRVAWLGTPLWFSDDLYRYLFEGELLLNGFNPFIETAASSPIASEWAEKVNHPTISSIYPPLAMAWFQLIALTGSVLGAQALTAAMDLVTIGVLRHVRERAAWVWAVHPLAIVESAGSAHLEPVGVALAAVALLGASGFFTALAAGVKVLPVLWLPRARGWLGAVVGLGLSACFSGPMLRAGPDAWRAWRSYSGDWTFNGLLYDVLHLITWTPRPWLVALGGLIAAVGWIRGRTIAARWFAVAIAFLLTTPTLHPWYGLWLLAPALALGKRSEVLALSWLQGSYAILYTLSDGAWTDGWWLRTVTWGPAILTYFISRKVQPAERL